MKNNLVSGYKKDVAKCRKQRDIAIGVAVVTSIFAITTVALVTRESWRLVK